MSKREKIIIAVLVVVVLLGGYFLLGSRKSGPTAIKPEVVVKQLEETQKFVASVNQAKAQEPGDTVFAPYIIMRAKSKWPADPFLDRDTAVSFEAEKVKTEVPEITNRDLGLSYTGYLVAGSHIIAIINGIEYEVGDKLEREGDYVVRAVTPAQVIIGREGSTIKVVVPLEDSGM